MNYNKKVRVNETDNIYYDSEPDETLDENIDDNIDETIPLYNIELDSDIPKSVNHNSGSLIEICYRHIRCLVTNLLLYIRKKMNQTNDIEEIPLNDCL